MWFKQDDTFDQPYIWMNMKIISNDCGFPYTVESEIYALLWQKMLFESQREVDYMAGLAGISAGLSIGGDSLKFSHWSYNDNIESYLEEIFKVA